MLVLVGVGTMASLASLGSLGSGSSSIGLFEGNFSLVRRVSLSRGKFKDSQKRWHRVSFCKCSLTTTTDYLAEQGNVVSLDTDTYKGTRNVDDDAEKIVLQAAPKPVLRSPGPTWEASRTSDEKSVDLEDRNSVMESLGEVLEKAEKLETSTASVSGGSRGSSVSVNKPVPLNATEPVPELTGRPAKPEYRPKPLNSSANSRPQNPTGSNNVKSPRKVWRKGDTVSSVPKVVNLSPTVDSVIEKEETKAAGEVKVESPPQPTVAPKPPLPPLRPPTKLQPRPTIAPPPMLRKPVILKDMGAAPKSQVVEADPNVKRKPILKDVGAGPKSLVTDETTERKPILVDKNATKKVAVDPSVAQAAVSPRKPAGKFKAAPNRRNIPVRGSRRRLNDQNPNDAGSRRGRKQNKATRRAARLEAARDAAPVKVDILEVGEKGLLIEDLAHSLAINVSDVYGTLFSKGIRPEGVQTVDRDMVKMICKEYDVEVIDADPFRLEDMAKKKEIFDEEDLENLEDRPPVLTIMGHVDHGKTTLLDHIRKSRVAASEAGGITQGIGAYKVLVPFDGELQPCVFLDTPGHEAFGAMRARGARVTDIAIIVVAADDGIRPQTNEAIAHAKAAGVPIVIAINKIDKEGASAERVMQELSSIGLMPEEWGGDVPMVQISALKGENVDELLETVMLVAELQELQANPHRNAKGTVIEAGLDKSKGPVATFIVQNGTLKKGDIVVCGEAFGKMRALFDDSGKQIAEAGPSIPVQVIGLNNVPIAGDEFEVVDTLDIAREKAEARAELLRNERILAKAEDGKVTLFSLAAAVSKRTPGVDVHQLNLVLKVDVQGSIEAIKQALRALPQENVTLKFLMEATGDVNTSDVDLAVVGEAIIFGFNTKVSGAVKKYADQKGVEIRIYKVIYELIDDMRRAMEGLLDPVEEHIPIGSAEVRAVFSSGSSRIAGCMVIDGKLLKDCGIRVLRQGREMYVGTLNSLRRVKEDVKEVGAGLECGVLIDGYTGWEEGDTIEAFTTVQKKRTLEEASATMAAVLEGGNVRL